MNKFFLNVVFVSNMNISQYEDLSDDIDKFENLVLRTADKYTSNYSVKAVKEKNFISVFIFEYFSKLYMEKVISNLGHIKANKDFYIAAKSQEINHRYLIGYNGISNYNRLVCKCKTKRSCQIYQIIELVEILFLYGVFIVYFYHLKHVYWMNVSEYLWLELPEYQEGACLDQVQYLIFKKMQRNPSTEPLWS